MADKWKNEYGFDNVSKMQYEMMLSYPDEVDKNLVRTSTYSTGCSRSISKKKVKFSRYRVLQLK